MKTFKNQCAQGDLLITKISEMPKEISEAKKETKGRHIVAHSETGHHHTISDENSQFYRHNQNPMFCYLSVSEPSLLEHERPFDTHEPILIGKGFYEIRRQREYVPEGWRRIAD